MTGAERAELDTLRAEVMSELRALRDEIRELRGELGQVRRELDTLQGGIQLVRWIGPAGVALLVAAFAKVAGIL